MPVPGFRGLSPWAVAKRAAAGFVADDMPTHAAALAFRALLALAPFAAVLLALLGPLGLAGVFDRLVAQAQSALPPDVAGVVGRVVAGVRDRPPEGLLSFGLAAALWTASAAVRALMTALNAAHGVRESRPVWVRYPLSAAYALGLGALLVAAAALGLAGPRAAGWVAAQAGLAGPVAALWAWLRWPAALLLLLAAVAAAYRLAPDADRPFRWLTPGSALAAAAWVLASVGFAAYAERFGSLGAAYGGLAGAVVLLLYLHLSAAALLLGAEVDAAVDRLAAAGNPDHRHDPPDPVCPFP